MLAVVSFDWLQRTEIWGTGVKEAHLVKNKTKKLLAAAHEHRLCSCCMFWRSSVFMGIAYKGVHTDRKSHHNHRYIMLARLRLNQTGVTLQEHLLTDGKQARLLTLNCHSLPSNFTNHSYCTALIICNTLVLWFPASLYLSIYTARLYVWHWCTDHPTDKISHGHGNKCSTPSKGHSFCS